MTEAEIKLDEATKAVLASFVRVGPEVTEADEKWAEANFEAKTIEYHQARRYAKAALGYVS